MWYHKSLIHSCSSIGCRIYLDRLVLSTGEEMWWEDNLISLVKAYVKYLKIPYTCIWLFMILDRVKMNITGLDQNLVLQEKGPDLQVPVKIAYGIWSLYISRFFWVISAVCFLIYLDALLCFLSVVFFPCFHIFTFQFLIASSLLKSLSKYNYSGITLPL